MTHAGRVDSVPATPAPATEHGGTHGHVASPRHRPIPGVADTSAFGFTGLRWFFAGPGVNAELGLHALLRSVPMAAAGVLFNLQAKHPGERWPDTAGGTPNDTFRLHRDRHPYLARAKITAGTGRVAVDLDTMEQERAIGARDDFTTWGRSGRIGGMA